jgi:phosphatidylglycerophosphate synthase
MADFLSILVVLFLRIGGVILSGVAILHAYYAMWFRLEGSHELRMIEGVDLEIGAMFAIALLLFFAPDCRVKPKAWLVAIVVAVSIWTCVSGFLIWSHREQHRIRSMPPLSEGNG